MTTVICSSDKMIKQSTYSGFAKSYTAEQEPRYVLYDIKLCGNHSEGAFTCVSVSTLMILISLKRKASRFSTRAM